MPPRRFPHKPQRGKPGFARPGEEGRYWMFGLHAVREALINPRRVKRRLIVTLNARERLGEALAGFDGETEIADPRKFPTPLDPNSVHQGVAMEVEPLDWGGPEAVCPAQEGAVALLLDRVTDPHNVGAVLRSALVFGASAVIAPARHSAPETGALAKAASGALEHQPYLRVRNLADAMIALQERGYVAIALDGEAPVTLDAALKAAKGSSVALALGAEGPGLRQRTRETADSLARLPASSDFASLNVSNAAAVALYAARSA